MTDDEIRRGWVARRVRAVLYDAKNSTSIEDEIRDLVENFVAPRMTTAEMRAELEAPDCLQQDVLMPTAEDESNG